MLSRNRVHPPCELEGRRSLDRPTWQARHPLLLAVMGSSSLILLKIHLMVTPPLKALESPPSSPTSWRCMRRTGCSAIPSHSHGGRCTQLTPLWGTGRVCTQLTFFSSLWLSGRGVAADFRGARRAGDLLHRHFDGDHLICKPQRLR